MKHLVKLRFFRQIGDFIFSSCYTSFIIYQLYSQCNLSFLIVLFGSNVWKVDGSKLVSKEKSNSTLGVKMDPKNFLHKQEATPMLDITPTGSILFSWWFPNPAYFVGLITQDNCPAEFSSGQAHTNHLKSLITSLIVAGLLFYCSRELLCEMFYLLCKCTLVDS